MSDRRVDGKSFGGHCTSLAEYINKWFDSRLYADISFPFFFCSAFYREHAVLKGRCASQMNNYNITHGYIYSKHVYNYVVIGEVRFIVDKHQVLVVIND